MKPLLPRQKRELFELLTRGSLSRTELAQVTGTRRNTVYEDVAVLLGRKLLRETGPAVAGVGRPRTPLELDPASRHVLGVSFQPGRVEVGRFNLLGEPLGETHARSATDAPMRAAGRLVRDHADRNTLAVGVSIPGLIDRDAQRVLFSAAFPDRPVSLKPVADAAGGRATVVSTEAHAVAARWLLTHAHAPTQDTLLIYFVDGSLGAAFIVNGRPNQGSISGGNEIGHTRLNVETRRCYCGGGGCLERICDSHDLRDHGLPVGLAEALRQNMLDHPALTRMTRLLGLGVANAVNFTRAARLIVASQLPGSGPLIDRIIAESRAQMLPQLRDRTHINAWPHTDARSAHTAAFLALTSLYYEDW